MEDLFSSLLAWISKPVLVQVFTIVLATVVANFVVRYVLRQLLIKAEKSNTVWDDALIGSIHRPMSLLIWVVGLSWAAEFVSFEAQAGLAEIIEPIRFICVVGLITMFLSKFVSNCEDGFIANGSDVTTAHAIGKLLRISVFITAALTVLQTLGISISGILAFGGVGGIAVGFAAKDLLANFFGGLMVYLDRPFAVGDWIRSPDRNIEGTVEKIGWRLTIIRTFDSRPLYVPNSVFTSIALENPSRMRNRRIYETIGIRYADAAKVKVIVDDVRSMLSEHEDIDPTKTLIVNFNTFAASSLDFFVYTFTKTTNWVEFHGVKEKVLLEIYAVVEAHGAEVAFPTSTIHLEPDRMDAPGEQQEREIS